MSEELVRRGVSDAGLVTGDTEDPTAMAQRFSPVSNRVEGAYAAQHASFRDCGFDPVTLTGMAGRRSADAAVAVGAHELEHDDEPPNALWRYVPTLRREDDEWRLRLVLHDFGLVWEDAPIGRRSALVSRAPDRVDPRWDAFLAAYVEHRCIEDGLEPPAWTLQRERHLREFWYAGGCHDYDRVRTIVTTPITFEAHGIWFPREELAVV